MADDFKSFVLNASSPNMPSQEIDLAVLDNIPVEENSAPYMNEDSILNYLPNTTEFEKYGCQLKLDVKKSNHYLYSSISKKIYVGLNNNFYITATWKNDIPPIGQLRLRAQLMFLTDSGEPIEACPKHMPKDNKDPTTAKRVLICGNPDAKYIISNGKKPHYSVYIPLDVLKNISLMLKCCCRNSCFAKKQIAITVTLEDDREVYCNKIMEIKVCSQILRDLISDENKMMEENRGHDKIESNFECSRSKKKLKRANESSKTNNYDILQHKELCIRIPPTQAAEDEILELAKKLWDKYYLKNNKSPLL